MTGHRGESLRGPPWRHGRDRGRTEGPSGFAGRRRPCRQGRGAAPVAVRAAGGHDHGPGGPDHPAGAGPARFALGKARERVRRPSGQDGGRPEDGHQMVPERAHCRLAALEFRHVVTRYRYLTVRIRGTDRPVSAPVRNHDFERRSWLFSGCHFDPLPDLRIGMPRSWPGQRPRVELQVWQGR